MQPTITFRDTITTSVVTTGDEQITAKVEEISKQVDGKETLHITKMEVREQHFNNQIDKPTLNFEKITGIPSSPGSNNNSAPNSGTQSRSDSATHSRNNSSEFFMPDLSFDRNLTPRSDSWNQEQNTRKKMLADKDREDEEFINTLRLEREDRDRKKKETKDQPKPRKTEKIKVKPVVETPVARHIEPAPPVIAPVQVTKLPDVAPPLPAGKTVFVANHDDVVIIVHRNTAAIVVVVLAILLYLIK